jgi:hypothetical protein
MPTLSEMEANPPSSRLERPFDVVLDAALVRRIAGLLTEAEPLATSPKPAARARYAELIAEVESLQPELEAKSGTLVLRANVTSGEWRNFVDGNPPRPESTPGHERDQVRAAGVVNADALVDELHKFAHSWDGEILREGQFDRLLRDNIPPGDLIEMATAVVMMYEMPADFGKWRSALSNGLQRLSAFAAPETSESAPSDSTAGNLEPSSEATTETETA